MDNELEIVTEVTNDAAEAMEKPGMLKTVAPIAGAFVLGGLAGFAFTNWVLKPILAKKAAKKTAEVDSDEEKSEE